MANSSLDNEELSDHLWTGAFSIIMIISILGNTIVLWTVLGKSIRNFLRRFKAISFKMSAHRRMWSLTNYFLVNLAIADLGMATLNCIPSFIFMRDR